jgi:hypothetical protein
VNVIYILNISVQCADIFPQNKESKLDDLQSNIPDTMPASVTEAFKLERHLTEAALQ